MVTRDFRSGVANSAHLDYWKSKMVELNVNHYQGLAFRQYFESAQRLLVRRDDIDLLREGMDRDLSKRWGYEKPTLAEQEELYERTRVFFDTFYSTLSALSGVVSRFSSVFNRVAINDNAPFVKWITTYWGDMHDTRVELERARLFRALLNHPQQFPVQDWLTASGIGRENMHIVVFGDQGRGKNPIPLGATGTHPWIRQGDWVFEAPDELETTNALANAAAYVLAAIIAEFSKASALRNALSLEQALDFLYPPVFDATMEARLAEAHGRGRAPFVRPPGDESAPLRIG